MNDPVQLLEKKVSDFVVPLRMMSGYDENRFEDMCNAIRHFNNFYAASDNLPKGAVLVLVNIVPSIDGCLSLYEGTELERILEASALVTDVILEGL